MLPWPSQEKVHELRKTWGDKLVKLRTPVHPMWARFAGHVGRVVTINYNGNAVVDFADGAWYDVAEFEKNLELVTDVGNYDATANSAQRLPMRQS